MLEQNLKEEAVSYIESGAARHHAVLSSQDGLLTVKRAFASST
jgi:hypothetical protein